MKQRTNREYASKQNLAYVMLCSCSQETYCIGRYRTSDVRDITG